MNQEDASILLLRVALVLLGEARLRGDFGDEAAIRERAVALADEFTGGAPPPDPRRPPIEVDLLRPDRISLAASLEPGHTSTWSLMLDGTLYDGGTIGRVTAKMIDRETLSTEERADLERREKEREASRERERRFTAFRFVRAVAAPPQPTATYPVLAVLLYEDGFYVEYTYDKEEPMTFDPEMDAAQFFAARREDKPEIAIADDSGTDYFESGGGGWGGGVRVSHSSQGFAPAPPPEAGLLRVTVNGETVDLDLIRFADGR
jgi:hypothetical protein